MLTSGLVFFLSDSMSSFRVAIIGGGPAGLMAAETLASQGAAVTLYDAMPSVGRKFLLAGRGGLNLTHSEAPELFLSRYGKSADAVSPWLEELDASALREWAYGLGIETFIGTSGRVFPKEMKAAPLLRTWLQRLREQGIQLRTRHVWRGWGDDDALLFDTSHGPRHDRVDAVVLALGGASWPRLGSNGGWQALLEPRGVDIAPLLPANGGFLVSWSEHFSQRFAGQPLKAVAMVPQGDHSWRRGECMISVDGIEGGLIYAWSAPLRAALLQNGSALFFLDLLPQHSAGEVLAQVSRSRGSRSWSSHLDSRLGLKGVKQGLLHEVLSKAEFNDAPTLARTIKRLPVRVRGQRPLAEAISTAGGVRFDALDGNLMLHALPGVFCAGEMLDWEAPTGGYLLTACFASGRAVGQGVWRWLNRQP
jgi:uncharacterized flavoprotein (TIGR03862 family)